MGTVGVMIGINSNATGNTSTANSLLEITIPSSTSSGSDFSSSVVSGSDFSSSTSLFSSSSGSVGSVICGSDLTSIS